MRNKVVKAIRRKARLALGVAPYAEYDNEIKFESTIPKVVSTTKVLTPDCLKRWVKDGKKFR